MFRPYLKDDVTDPNYNRHGNLWIRVHKTGEFGRREMGLSDYQAWALGWGESPVGAGDTPEQAICELKTHLSN